MIEQLKLQSMLMKNITLKESASILNILSEKDFDKLVNPTEMIAPNKKKSALTDFFAITFIRIR